MMSEAVARASLPDQLSVEPAKVREASLVVVLEKEAVPPRSWSELVERVPADWEKVPRGWIWMVGTERAPVPLRV